MIISYLKKIINYISIKKIALVIVILFPIAYWYGRTVFIDQTTGFIVTLSNLSVNFFLFLLLFGYWLDKKLKKLPKWENWLVWGVCMVLMTLLFKFGFGWNTIW